MSHEHHEHCGHAMPNLEHTHPHEHHRHEHIENALGLRVAGACRHIEHLQSNTAQMSFHEGLLRSILEDDIDLVTGKKKSKSKKKKLKRA